MPPAVDPRISFLHSLPLRSNHFQNHELHRTCLLASGPGIAACSVSRLDHSNARLHAGYLISTKAYSMYTKSASAWNSCPGRLAPREVWLPPLKDLRSTLTKASLFNWIEPSATAIRGFDKYAGFQGRAIKYNYPSSEVACFTFLFLSSRGALGKLLPLAKS